MKTTHRSYSEVSGDFNRLCQFIVAQNGHLRTHSTWSLGRLVDWKYGLYENKLAMAAFCDQNAHLWFDAYRKRGFARAVIQECLCRLRDMGLRSAYITGYSPEAIALYGSLGAVGEMKSFVYEMAAS